ncbi:putative pentatricopeptide repeat-containing protein [Prunus yedoensis var. nudiflora]|uniref:Putative pentatricopeptide repeat-containing protein n=1 Tax=Prunus yedoensis var. nudiflora TaxID=2094558 RepID=A0A314YKG3_PRUYE|nr:putative pentatricopeptide repeat-containing protein [Prunus yedoensis var. nudiflora]
MPEKNSVTWACLISGYTQNGMPNEACAHFKQMVSDGFPRVLTLAVVFFELARSLVLASLSLGCKFMVYCQRGDAISAFKLFSSMQKDGSAFSLQPNEYTFGSLITAACSLAHDLYVGSALVSGFARFGLIDYARKIFEQMSERNAVSMNGLMVALVRQKRGKEATEVFMEMKDLVGINLDSLVVLLSSFSEFSVLEEGKRKGREVHAYVIGAGLIYRKVAIGNGLINMYAKCGAISDACSVFRHMVDKDLISWNSLISGLDQNELFEDAVMNFLEMRRSELLPSISLSNALLALYSETGHLSECRNVFFSMQDYDQVSWNSIIGALAGSEASVLEAVEYFLDMMQSGWELNRVTFMSILAAVSSLSLPELGQQIHAVVLKYNAAEDCAIENALITCYGKCGGIDDCEKIFSRMSERRDEISWNSMISGYIHNEFLPKAMDLVWFMMQRGQRLDSFTFATVLSACASVATLERGMEVHACGIRACSLS